MICLLNFLFIAEIATWKRNYLKLPKKRLRFGTQEMVSRLHERKKERPAERVGVATESG